VKVGDMVQVTATWDTPGRIGVIAEKVESYIADKYIDELDSQLPSWWILWNDGDLSWYHEALLVTIDEEQKQNS